MRRPGGPARDFEVFVRAHEPGLRRALVAAYGHDAGREATVEALGWAWSHWDRVVGLDRPVGYLFRVGQTKAREARSHRLVPVGDVEPGGEHRLPWIEPGLDSALDTLSEPQRVAVVLCHGFQWTHREVADLLEVSPSTVQNHVERGLAKLRHALEATTDA